MYSNSYSKLLCSFTPFNIEEMVLRLCPSILDNSRIDLATITSFVTLCVAFTAYERLWNL
ncbi:hypothetical protein JRYRANMO_CDS_0129 [Salmonella phage FM4b]|nr:hypothetical protein IKARNLZQ_CDS_0128 [Salmonella phage FG1m]WVH07278.1 hypothetical protein JRYRANMO_CDS_0129 [Salmonella phage FM4b]